MLKSAISLDKWLERSTFSRSGGRLPPGLVVDEWRVVVFIGSGLSAEVYRVKNVRTGAEAALKLLTDPTRGLKERFQSESDALRFLSLRSLPRFLGCGTCKGAPYYVMEYLQPLPDPMPRGEIPRFMIRVARAVQSLHEAGFVHRDLKPGNILRRRSGEPVLIDLGLIKRRGTGVTDPIVRHGKGISIIDGKPVGVGTLDYAAPEQLLKGEASVQSDIFSLGKILRAFYEGRTPLSLKPIVRRATRELPGDRYASARAFASAIRWRYLSQILLLLALLAAGGAAFLVLPRLLAPTPTPPPTPVSPVIPMPEPFPAPDPEPEPIPEPAPAPTLAEQAKALFWGLAGETNRVEAVRLYTEAAEEGDAAAMGDLAYCYINGFGVEKNLVAGFQWALEGAERGNVASQAIVGECYALGIGVEKNEDRADVWLRLAAKQGNARAQAVLDRLQP